MNLKTTEKERVVNFLNRAQTAAEITDPAVLKDHENKGYTIGEEVAKRILEIRNILPAKRFMGFHQVEAVPGLGNDKLKDLAFSISPPAAEAFRQRMYDGVILDNWQLTAHTVFFDDRRAFFDLVQTASRFRDWVGEQVKEMAFQKSGTQQIGRLAKKLLQCAFLESFDTSHYGAIAFAFWLYRFDADNWFSFEQVREETERYLGYYAKNQHRLELRLFKDFDVSTLVQAISVDELPVVVNYGEQEVTIWTAQLND
ncbi:MAG: hypothetical protein ACKV1O_05500 [Saprospiraceae bacterium]